VKVTVQVSVLKPCDKNIDVETERAYNRAIDVTIEAYGMNQHYDLNGLRHFSYKGNIIHVPI
jgi:hypothetical protein